MRKTDFLLTNVDINPVAADIEILVCFRSKDSYLVNLATSQVLAAYDSIDEVRFGRFSQCGRFIYTLTRTGTLNIFNKTTAKLISKLNENESDIQIDGILGVSETNLGEKLVVYRRNRVIKYAE